MDDSARKKILIIDDEESLCLILKKNLVKADFFDVSYALSGKEGIEAAKSFKPDLVFLDIRLYDVDGINLIGEILKIDSDIKIIILSGQGTHDYVQKAFQAGAVDFVSKPCDVDRLLKLIKSHLFIGSELLPAVKETLSTEDFTKTLFLDILITLVSITEAKSSYLKGHSERVSQLSKGIGIKIGLKRDNLEVLEFSGIIHDLGKVGVKDAILDKDGKLTDEEWESIKQHPVIGSDVINKMRLFRLEEPIVRSHHERFDGKGYPDGLKGHNIPLGSRIIALADSFDAMVSKRPYRSSLTEDQAVDEIKRNSGTQFDPEIASVFLNFLDKNR
ncbi:MAG: HD domain-containing phosphohydrolase [Candidatus Omnitrophota bacterium]